MWRKRALAVLLISILAGSLMDSGAQAHKRKAPRKDNRAPTTVTIAFEDNEPAIPIPAIANDPPDNFSGTAQAKQPCAQQVIEVVRTNGQLVGLAKVASNGQWYLEAEDPGDDTYIARLTNQGNRRRSARSHHRPRPCKRGDSPPLVVDDGGSGLV